MTIAETKFPPETATERATAAQDFPTHIIIDQWLLLDPAPGTFNEYRKHYSQSAARECLRPSADPTGNQTRAPTTTGPVIVPQPRQPSTAASMTDAGIQP
ncbi:hypothetical protein J2S90_001632 [Arthrobacter bambusae]|uniref:Uncharacterized protein n=1 Tax=Arthrobacter bambusae TaxID=1338426 RepID=A0AAW8DFK0_9MICC|nr:hypothetical protein [Arthrobacter bambusae]MDQ0129493.1 hypothetical protein [Arthrobacter bambusae]MDQ0180894.1 hypothetical protein [Arthrobacter bambusae]